MTPNSRATPATPPALARLMTGLGFAGLIPFVLPVILLIDFRWLEISPAFVNQWAHHLPHLFLSYSVIIFSFLAGTLFTLGLRIKNPKLAVKAVILSNLLALMAWVLLLLVFVEFNLVFVALPLLMIGYGLLLWIEYKSDAVEATYLRMRVRLSTGVISLHGLMLLILMRW